MPTISPYEVFSLLDPPLWLVTARAADRRSGLIATFVNQASISLEHPRVIVGMARQHFTWELVQRGGAFVLHLFGEDQLEWVWRFGLQSGRTNDKFAGLSVAETARGNPYFAEALAWMECVVEASWSTGDRALILAEVKDAHLCSTAPALTQQRMLQLAPPEKLDQLKKQMERDRRIDAIAIEEWRSARDRRTKRS